MTEGYKAEENVKTAAQSKVAIFTKMMLSFHI